MSECKHEGGIYGDYCHKCVPEFPNLKIQRLQDENRRLRKALEDVDMLCPHDTFCPCLREVWKIAYEALGGR